jgi:chromosome segregation ATPase
MRRAIIVLLAVASVLAAAGAHGQTTTEDRLREAVKKLTADLRAAEDAAGPLRQKLDEATRQRDALQTQLDAAKADLAAKNETVQADAAKLQKLQADLDAAHKDDEALRAELGKWQAAYKQAAGIAQAKDADAKRLDATLKTTRDQLEAAKQANTKLVAAARDILHLYETRSFRRLLVQGYEPLLGLKRVDLENIVQDYEDRIEDGRLPTAAPAAAPPAATPPSAGAPAAAPPAAAAPAPK